MRDGWSHVLLGELLVQVKQPVKVKPGLTYKLLGVRWYGNGPFIREIVTSETSKATRLFPVQPGDFIYNRLFAWKGSFGLIARELEGCFVSSEFPLFRVRQDRLDAVLLNLIMCQPSKWAQIEIESTGSTSVSRNRWKEERFLEQVVFLPPIDEQKRIVDVVSSVDAYIDALQQRVDTARVARNAVLHELLSAGGDDWTETTLSSVALLNPKEPGLSADAPFVPMDAVHVGKRYVQYHEPRGNRSGARANTGDVLFARITPCLENGKVAQIQNGIERCGGSTEFIVIRGTSALDSDFVYFWATWSETRNRVAGLMTGTTGRQRLSAGDLGALSISVPPLEEQKRIVAIVSSMDEVIQSTQQAVVDAKNLRSGLLSDLLSGEHEIPASYDFLLKVA